MPARASAAVPTADEIVARAQALGVGDEAQKLRSRFLPGVRLLHGGTSRLGGTRIGGRPDMTRSASWPSCHKHALSFVMQVDVADLGRGDTGTLAIFADLRDNADGYAAFLDVDGKIGCLVQARFMRGELVRRRTPHGVETLRNTPLRPRPILTVPGFDAVDKFLGGKRPETFIDEWGELVDETDWGVLGAEPPYRPVHQLLGWSWPIQWDPTLYGACKGDVPLVQIDDDAKAGFEYGDAGVLYLDIKPADLKARRYDRLCGEFQDS